MIGAIIACTNEQSEDAYKNRNGKTRYILLKILLKQLLIRLEQHTVQ